MKHIAFLLSFSLLWAICSAQGDPPAVRDQRLIDAIKRNDVRAVRTLLTQGAHPNTHQRRTWKYIPNDQMTTDFRYSKRRTGMQPPSALLMALGIWATDDPHFKFKPQAAHPEIVKALVEAGANVNEREPDMGATPLMAAVREDDAATVKLLLRHGAHVNATDKQGTTALMVAVLLSDRNRSESVKLLLRHGANPNAMTHQGDRPLTLARRAEYIPLLVRAGARVNARDKQVLTVLARVKKEQSTFFPASDAVVQILHKWGARQ